MLEAMLIAAALGLAGGATLVAVLWILLRRRARSAPIETRTSDAVVERITRVGKISGLEVQAKEIATATQGWSWLPPLLLSQARLAMIFHFERRYEADLSRLTADDVRPLPGGRYEITLPPVEGTLRLLDVRPYDIQQGRVLGLLDVIPMNAERQGALMEAAQRQAGELFDKGESRYAEQARDAIERHLLALLALVGVRAEIRWTTTDTHAPPLTPPQHHAAGEAAAPLRLVSA